MAESPKFANPRSDIAFKKLFAVQKDSALTISFVNAILNRQEGELITELTIIDSANFPEHDGSKKTFIDVKCKDEKDKTYIIEIQVAPEDDFFDRALYYSSKNVSNQLHEGDEYRTLKPVIFIGVLNFILFKDDKDYLSRYKIKNDKTNKVGNEKMSFNFIELPKFEKKLESLETKTDLWIYFMKEANKLKSVPEQMQKQKEFKKAFHNLERDNWSSEEQAIYAKEVHDERSRKSQRTTAINEGILTGELNKSIKIAKKMLSLNKTLEEIIEITDLSKDQIKQLLKNQK